MRYKRLVFVSCFIMIFTCVVLTSAETGNPQETLKQYMSDLQKNPDDFALREKIIKLVQGMTPQPVVPEEAERYFARGRAAVKGASTAKDFEDAANEFNKALTIAPWFAEGYYNLGIVQDKAGKYQDAIRSLKLYLLAAPNAPDAKEVKSLMFEVEYRQEKAQKETVAKKKEEEAKPDFSGSWGGDGTCWENKFLISGSEFTITTTCNGRNAHIYGMGTINGRNFEGSSPGVQMAEGMFRAPMRFKGSLSEDNRMITISTIVAPELAKTSEARNSAQGSIQVFGQKWETSTWTRVSK